MSITKIIIKTQKLLKYSEGGGSKLLGIKDPFGNLVTLIGSLSRAHVHTVTHRLTHTHNFPYNFGEFVDPIKAADSFR